MRVSRALINEVSRSVTNRDKALCLHIYEHRFLTTHQAARLFFSSEARARTRLIALWRLRVLNRFRPVREFGSHPWYYVLDEVGVLICEAMLGVQRLRYDRTRALAQAYSPRLAHMTEVNDFFTQLAATASHDDSVRLAHWLGERGCEDHWSGAIHPDGFAIVETASARLEFVLELDGGTESGPRLADKIADYAAMSGASDAPHLIAFCFQTPAREARQRRALEGCPLPVATAVLREHMTNPLGDNWLTVPGRARQSLIDLATSVGRRLTPAEGIRS